MLLLFFYYSVIFRCIYMLQVYRYRRVEENHDSSAFLYYRNQQQHRIEHWFGSPRNNIWIDSSCESRNVESQNRDFLRQICARKNSIVSCILRDKKRANLKKVISMRHWINNFKIKDYQKKHLHYFLDYWHTLILNWIGYN